MSLLSCEQLEVRIAGKQVCRNLNLSVEAGQCWGILGRNGVGKTTLLHTLANLRKPDAGSVNLIGTPLSQWSRRKLARNLAILTQDSHDPFPATVLETALIGRHPHTPAWRAETAEDVMRAKAALAAVALESLAHRDVSTLSGGERQRLALATVLAQAPNVFLLDEPTNHLDLHYQVNLLDMLTRHASERDAAIITTLHDVNLAARFCDHLILLLGDGEVAFGSVDDMLSEEYLHRLYQHCIVKLEQGKYRAFLPG